MYPEWDAERVWVSLREGDLVYKLARPGGGELEHLVYDLARDPSEGSNLYDPGDPVQRQRFDDLEVYRAALRSRIGVGIAAGEPSGAPRPIDLLRRLGYVE